MSKIMKKVLFFVLLCLFAFTACEQKKSYENERDYQIDEIKPEEEINYCEVSVKIIRVYFGEVENFKITYEGGYGLYEGTYLVPQGTHFSVKWDFRDDSGRIESYKETFEVATAKTLKVEIRVDEANIVSEFMKE